MISKQDVENLAKLARIQVTPEESQSLTSEIESILGYVGQVKEIASSGEEELPVLRNVLREDEVIHTPGEFSEDLLELSPERENNYVKVKKILE